MKILKIIAYFFATVILLFIGFLVYSTLTWYNPEAKLVITESSKNETIHCDSVYKALSWNIGYAGLGSNMDFFYDRGTKVRDTYERTIINLDSVRNFIKKNSDNQFILLQEVDLNSKRSYRVNQKDSIERDIMKYNSVALNYSSWFVPVPPDEPMGKVKSGLVSFCDYEPKESVRYAYPGMFSWPNRLFNLRRCMLVNRYNTINNKEFIVINTHMSAFDDGSLKKQEMQFIKDFVLGEYEKGNYVLVGGDWNQSPPDFKITTFGDNFESEVFKLTNISSDFLPEGWNWVYDASAPTNRYLNEPYTEGKTFRSILDFFLVSPNITVINSKTQDLNFQNADHNPVFIQFMLKN